MGKLAEGLVSMLVFSDFVIDWVCVDILSLHIRQLYNIAYKELNNIIKIKHLNEQQIKEYETRFKSYFNNRVKLIQFSIIYTQYYLLFCGSSYLIKMTASLEFLMQQVWMELLGPKTSCSLIHPHASCTKEIIIKCLSVLKSSTKMYVALYLAMFAFKFKKMNRQRKIQKNVVKYGKDFLFSLAFMSWMVGGMKTALCGLNYFEAPLDIRTMPVLSLLGSLSIFFNDCTKQSQISYFVFVRCCRSAYIFLKKRWHFGFQNQKQFCFIAIFVFISYLYFEGEQNLTNRNLLQNLWGEV